MPALGPDDPRAIRDKERYREHTDRFREDVLGFKPRKGTRTDVLNVLEQDADAMLAAAVRDQLDRAMAVALDYMDYDTHAMAAVVHIIEGRGTDVEKIAQIQDVCVESEGRPGVAEVGVIVGVICESE